MYTRRSKHLCLCRSLHVSRHMHANAVSLRVNVKVLHAISQNKSHRAIGKRLNTDRFCYRFLWTWCPNREQFEFQIHHTLDSIENGKKERVSQRNALTLTRRDTNMVHNSVERFFLSSFQTVFSDRAETNALKISFHSILYIFIMACNERVYCKRRRCEQPQKIRPKRSMAIRNFSETDCKRVCAFLPSYFVVTCVAYLDLQ